MECQASCNGESTSVGCGDSSTCADGEVCCGTLAQAGNYYTDTACSATCEGASSYVLCADDGECSGGLTCQASMYLPQGFEVCRQ